ncbi:galactocerebrosidase-like isoform X2 [Littorina saxatilis]|uniref:galactocerebrosidase-like isoform X2 n=1 Tax=Littorina saxatilis TaxID=31220 RepID=UPI0038B54663
MHLTAVSLAFVAALSSALAVGPWRATTYDFDDSSGLGRQYDGIGGLSGGGATSKLLVNYPEKERNEILDYLFKPNFGASLQILKVEIGGDAQSTDGTEASHMHNSWDENYQRGYEWWLMVEAKKRNPNIKLYCLPWGFPGWVGQGSRNPYQVPEVTADYIIRWINGAKTVYGLTMDFVGIWNERPYNSTYIKTLRKMLDARGFSNTRIVAPDGAWTISKDINKDPALAAAVDYIGCHYPGTLSTDDALKTGKQLWASEDYSTYNDEVGGGCWARILNKNYAVGRMTATISWNLIASYYNPLPFFRDGLMTAVEPWSGNYNVDTPIWLSAHTTQFTQVGWKYLEHGAGVGLLEGGGSYVALVSPDKKDFTIIVETMSHNHSLCIRPPLPAYDVVPQTMNIQLKGSFANIKELNVWYSKLGFDGQQSIMFQKKDALQLKNGMGSASLGMDEVYTFTTVTTGDKGQYDAPPPSKSFPLPYSDNFDSYAISEEPYNLAPQTGSLEAVSSNSARGKIARQTVLQTPAYWCRTASDTINKSLTVIGNFNWSDIYVEVEALVGKVNATDGVFVAARVQNGGCQSYSAKGIFFFVFPAQQYYIISYDLARTQQISSGAVSSEVMDWNKISLLVTGTTIQGQVNGKSVFNIQAPKMTKNGFVAIGTDTYGLADFDNFMITTASDGRRIMRENEERAHAKAKHTLYFEPEKH